MRISIRHLLIGMSLGAVVVFFYGFNKLKTPNLKSPITPVQTENIYTDEVEPFSTTIQSDISFLIEPEIEKQVQFMIINRLNKYPYEPYEEVVTPTPALTPTPEPSKNIASNSVASYSRPQQNLTLNTHENVITLIEKYASEYGVDKNMMIGIAKCESGFRENAVNGPYAGIYQFVSGTWISNRRAMGLDTNLNLRFNAEEAAKTAAFKMSRDGFGAWPVCQYKAQKLLTLNPNE
jgi:hypothetical protein